MFIDKELEFSDGQAITADAASTNIIDVGQTVDVAPGKKVRVRLQVDTTFDNLTSLTVTLQSDSTAAFSSAASLNQRVIALAALVAGAEFDLGEIQSPTEQFLRLYYDVTGTNPSAGAVSAFLEVYDAPEGDIGAIPGNL